MTKFIIAFALLFSFNVSAKSKKIKRNIAAATLSCTAEDGSGITAIVNSEKGSTPTQVKYSIRGSKARTAKVAIYSETTKVINGSNDSGTVKTIVLKDPKTNKIVMVIADGSLIDKTGVYSVDCEFGY